MKRLVAQIQDSKRADYDPDERGEVTAVGEHHGGSFKTYFAHKVTKLREQHQPVRTADNPIFKGCIMYVNGLTELPIEELRRLITNYGGEHIMYRAVKITHYVCNHFTDAQLKIEYAKVKLNAKNKVHNVTVAWVLESIRQCKRLNENLFVPKGLVAHGSVLSKSFLLPTSSESKLTHHDSSSSSSSSSSSNSNSMGGNSDAVNTKSTATSSSVPLTSSQELFLDSIPVELRAEALEQLAATANRKPSGSSAKKTCNRSCVENQSELSENEVIDLSGLPETDITGHSLAPNGLDITAEPTQRQIALQHMITYIHYTEQGALRPSKAVSYHIKAYLDTLIVTISRVVTTTETSTEPAIAVDVFVQLLLDYVIYLKNSYLFDQVQFLLQELNRQTAAADAIATQEDCGGGGGESHQEIVWRDVYTAVMKQVTVP